MPNIKITVAGKIATNTTPGEVIVCGNSDYTVTFDLDAEWAAEPKRTARFVFYKDGLRLYKDAEFTGNTVTAPVLSGIDYVEVGVYAGDLRTTTPARVLCDRSILCGDPMAVPPSKAEQLQAQIGDLSQLQTVAKNNLVDAINEAAKTGGTGSGSGENSSGGNSADSGQNPSQSGGLSTKAINLLITILRNGVYNTNQSANITALETALKESGGSSGGSGDSGGTETPDEPENPEVTLSSISATYSGGDVPAGTSVLALSGIVVIAHYSDGSAKAVEDYELSGEIGEGSNTVTVTYSGMTATFTVTGTVESLGYTWSSGYFTTNGGIGASSGMYCEEYFPAVPGESVYIYSADPTWPFTEGFACFYDSEKNFIARGSKIISFVACPEYEGAIVHLGTAPDNAAFFRACATGVSGYENSITICNYTELPKPYIALEDATWQAGYINNSGNFQTYPSGRWASSMVSVEPGATYRFGNSNPSCNLTTFYIGLYKTVTGGTVSVVGTAEFTVPENVRYVRLAAKTMNESDCATATLEKIS